jgi:flavin reductase (DIM6/NTAB) family NADH-FMN oxidoreductase RutF
MGRNCGIASAQANIHSMDDATALAALRLFPYGLYAITVKHEGDEHASTASWVTQASFHPPMVAAAIENTSKTIGMIRDAHHFAVSILHEGQREIAEKLGRPSAGASQKLKGIKTKPASTSGVPVVADALAWVECRVVATLPGGDHTIVLGEVVSAGVERDGAKPLTLESAGFTYSR